MSDQKPRLDGDEVLRKVRAWLARYICVLDSADLDVLTLWAAHTHLCVETYISPRLLIDSPVPGAGKTTTLEHLERLCRRPMSMAVISSAALLTRSLAEGIRTLLIDEVDKTLTSGREYVGDVIAVLNTGYKRGASRPVLVQMDGAWVTEEMPTFAPCAMAGTQPNLPDDTLSRCIRVLLLPADDLCNIEDSDWEWINDEAAALGTLLEDWADDVRDRVRQTRPTLPEGIRGRDRERWAPLKRVADAAGGEWPATVDKLATDDARRVTAEHEEGLTRDRPAVLALRHVREAWPSGVNFLPSDGLIALLIHHHPEVWGAGSAYGLTHGGRALTPQRLGAMLAKAYGVHTGRLDPPAGPRGYFRAHFDDALRRLRMEYRSPRRRQDEEVSVVLSERQRRRLGEYWYVHCSRSGCRNWAVHGETACRKHGASAPTRRRKAHLVWLLRGVMARALTPEEYARPLPAMRAAFSHFVEAMGDETIDVRTRLDASASVLRYGPELQKYEPPPDLPTVEQTGLEATHALVAALDALATRVSLSVEDRIFALDALHHHLSGRPRAVAPVVDVAPVAPVALPRSGRVRHAGYQPDGSFGELPAPGTTA